MSDEATEQPKSGGLRGWLRRWLGIADLEVAHYDAQNSNFNYIARRLNEEHRNRLASIETLRKHLHAADDKALMSRLAIRLVQARVGDLEDAQIIPDPDPAPKPVPAREKPVAKPARKKKK